MTTKTNTTKPAVSEPVLQTDAVMLAQITGLARDLVFTNYKTGSDGFRSQGKVTNADGVRFQVSLLVTRIGSKPTA